MHIYLQRRASLGEPSISELVVMAVIAHDSMPDMQLIHRADAVLNENLRFLKNRWPENIRSIEKELVITWHQAVHAVREFGIQLTALG